MKCSAIFAVITQIRPADMYRTSQTQELHFDLFRPLDLGWPWLDSRSPYSILDTLHAVPSDILSDIISLPGAASNGISSKVWHLTWTATLSVTFRSNFTIYSEASARGYQMLFLNRDRPSCLAEMQPNTIPTQPWSDFKLTSLHLTRFKTE